MSSYSDLNRLPEFMPTFEELEAECRRREHNKLQAFFPEEGPNRRELYPKHMQFIEAGSTHRERLFLAGNRVGKSSLGAFEMAVHLTGQYPAWWKGRRFNRPIRAWAAGDTSKTVREIIQEKLLGKPGELGTGMIPEDSIVKTTPKAGVPEAVEIVYVSHVSGGTSVLVLKSYDQGREAFQGTEQHLIWLDEEAPENIYTECVMRTMAAGSFPGGSILFTFTPINGWTAVVTKFLNPQEREQTHRFVITAEWNDAPHLSEEEKKQLYATLPPHQRDARSKGIPTIGSGAIYPVPESDISITDFEIPDYWPRAFALDTGWNWTAVVWGARDPESQTVYLYNGYKRGQVEPAVHASEIRVRGAWIPGVGDAAGINQYDGRRFIDIYRGYGLDITLPNKAVEAGLYETWQRLSAGKLKVFASLKGWFEEYRMYRRDEAGRIVKENDHYMDCTRYMVTSGIERMTTKKVIEFKSGPEYGSPGGSGLDWMAF
jgi:phage terminase large subunit-like protein